MTNAPLRRSAPRACFICQNSCSASTTLTGKCKTTYKSKSLLGSAFRAETKHCVLIKGELTRGAPFASTVAEPVFKRFNGPSYSSNQIYAALARAHTTFCCLAMSRQCFCTGAFLPLPPREPLTARHRWTTG